MTTPRYLPCPACGGVVPCWPTTEAGLETFRPVAHTVTRPIDADEPDAYLSRVTYTCPGTGEVVPMG